MRNLGVHGWARIVSSDKVHLVAPEGVAAGVITIRERAPQRRFEELVVGNVEHRWITPPSHVVNQEGEDGVFATLRIPSPQGEVQRDVAVFAGDGFCSSLLAVTARAELFDRTTRLVRTLATRTRLWLGVRRRLFLYPPPRGWRGVMRGLDAYWYAPEYPRDQAHMIIFAAVPAHATDASEVLDALQQQHPRDRWDETTRTTSGGLDMHVRTAAGIRLAVAVDGKYIYAAQIEHATSDQLAELDRLLDGVHPVPSTAVIPSAVQHWIE